MTKILSGYIDITEIRCYNVCYIKSEQRTDGYGVRPKSVTQFIVEKYSVIYRLRP